MSDPELKFFSESNIAAFFMEQEGLLEDLRTNPVKVVVDGGAIVGLNFVCEIFNKGFKYTFMVSRMNFEPETFKESLIEVLTELGVAVE